MTRATRYRINAAIAVLVIVYAVYQFGIGDAASSRLRAWLVAGEALVGIVGAVWFWRRSRAA